MAEGFRLHMFVANEFVYGVGDRHLRKMNSCRIVKDVPARHRGHV